MPAAPQTPVEEPPEPVEKAEPKPAAPVPKPASPAPDPRKPKLPPATVTAKAEEPNAKLDLSLPEELARQLEQNDVMESLPPSPLLPQMFVEKPAPQSPFQLNGKLITDQREDDYWRSVEGAELQFEFKR
ncbi:hypothetical protein J7302_19730 [Pseudomonas sp. DB1]|uniref:Translation initiation factor 2 n=1 Tax=Metapseudomonas boanensis TaxID=2822138 RepID=A0ABS5XKY4_9GAMM|nr:hypothetical protein [Pseudomonas boanensis]